MADIEQKSEHFKDGEEVLSLKKIKERLTESGFGVEMNENLMLLEERNHANASYRASPTG